MKRIFIYAIVAFTLSGCAELQQVASQLPQQTGVLSNADIANGLKEALDKGIDNFAECTTDNYSNCQVNNVALDGEFLKFFN